MLTKFSNNQLPTINIISDCSSTLAECCVPLESENFHVELFKNENCFFEQALNSSDSILILDYESVSNIHSLISKLNEQPIKPVIIAFVPKDLQLTAFFKLVVA